MRWPIIMTKLDQTWRDHADLVAVNVADRLRDNPPILPEYLNPKQAASFTGFTPKALERIRQRGDGPRYSKVGASIRYHIDDLRAWMEVDRVDLR